VTKDVQRETTFTQRAATGITARDRDMSVSDQFSGFSNNLTILNRDTVSTRYKAITKRLNLDFWEWESDSLHSLYSGSYGRGTAVRGKTDLDMAFWSSADKFCRDDNYDANGQSGLMQATRNSTPHS